MSDIIVNNNPTDLDPEVMKLMQPYVMKWEAAIYRVAASEVQPTQFLLPQAKGTIEEVLAKRFKRLPPEWRKTAGINAVNKIKMKKFTDRAGRLMSLSFGTPATVSDMVKPVKKVTHDQFLELAKARLQDLQVPPAATTAVFPSRILRAKFREIICIDETDGFLGSERGKDEIELGGIALDETADVGKVFPFKIGSFDDNTRKAFSPAKTLFSFNILEGAVYPKSYFLTLIMVEADNGNFSETISDIINKIEKDSKEYLAALIIGGIGAAGGPVGALVGAAVGYVVGKVFGAIIAAWKDDPFEPRTIEVIIPSPDATFNGKLMQPSQRIRFKGPGEYVMRYFWELSKT